MYNTYIRNSIKLLNKIKEKLSEWRDIPYSRIGGYSIFCQDVCSRQSPV